MKLLRTRARRPASLGSGTGAQAGRVAKCPLGEHAGRRGSSPMLSLRSFVGKGMEARFGVDPLRASVLCWFIRSQHLCDETSRCLPVLRTGR